MNSVPPVYWGALSFVFGAMVGSFLNVVIWRLPRGESLATPGSHCPHCSRPLTALENVPLVSFLALRARCRTCHTAINPRYFYVELLTAALFLALYLRFGPHVSTVAYCLFAASLVAGGFIDLELFIIPDELNNFALLVGVTLDLYLAHRGVAGHALIAGWLPRSLLNGSACALVFIVIQLIGLVLFRKDAMGDGDVKLARAIGTVLPIGVALLSFGMAIFMGAVIGGGALLLTRLMPTAEANSVEELEPIDEDSPAATPLPNLLGSAVMYLLYVDVMLQFGRLLRIPPLKRVADNLIPIETMEQVEDFNPTASTIPFGPYMVLGALLSLFVGPQILNWYLGLMKLR